jgi:hypothetical protein
MSCIIFVGLALITCSFYTLPLYSFRYIVMLTGLVITLIIILFSDYCVFLVVPSLLGRLSR